jgi:trk system potassium uptake protein
MDIAVIGLGRFGRNCALELMKYGTNVLGIDKSEDLVNQIKDKITKAYIMNSTNEDNLRELGIDDMDFVVVAIGENEQSSIFTTLLLKKIGVPRIIARATSEAHAEILELIGVEELILPEVQTAKKLARKLSGGNINEYFELSEDQMIAELPATEALADKTILELGIRKNFGLNIIGIRQKVPIVSEQGENKMTEKVTHIINPDYKVNLTDRLIVVGYKKDIDRFIKFTKEGK